MHGDQYLIIFTLNNIQDMIKEIKKFYREQILNPYVDADSGYRFFLIRQIRIIILAFRGFIEDRVSMRASALTFYTLLSVVPIAAMAFGVAKGFGFESKMRDFIIDNFKGQEDVMNYIIELSEKVLHNVEGGLLAGIGLIILVWSVMQVLTNIENSFNAIWQIKHPRPFLRKLSDYLAMMLIAPFLIILSSSVMVYISTKIQAVNNSYEVISVLTPLVERIISLVPYMLVWLLFTVVYIIMPNTKVHFKYALIAGILAGTLFQITQWAYIHFQVGVSRYSALYGTFAALPLFLAWLQISWLIVLLGAEISFAYQNVEKYEFESGSLNLSNHYKRLLSLYVAYSIIKNFQEGNEPMTSSQISKKLGIPIRLIRDIIFSLVNAKVLIETVTESPRENGYLPAVDINKMDIKFVIDRLDHTGSDHFMIRESPVFEKLSDMHEKIFKTLKKSNHNVLLKEI